MPICHCKLESLETRVASLLELKDLLADELHDLITGIQTLPSLPSMYREIRTKLQDPDVSIRDIAEIIESDPAMTARIIKIANSGFYSLKRKVTSAMDAASLIGLETLAALVLSKGLSSQFENTKLKDFSMLNYVQHSMEVAGHAKTIAELSGLSKSEAEECYTAGLLHDLGMLVMMQNKPDKYQQFKAALITEKKALHEVEKELFGSCHGSVGAYLLGLWDFPLHLVEAVKNHHLPSLGKTKTFNHTTAVHIASALSATSNTNDDTLVTFGERHIDMDHLSAIGMLDQLNVWREAVVASDD